MFDTENTPASRVYFIVIPAAMMLQTLLMYNFLNNLLLLTCWLLPLPIYFARGFQVRRLGTGMCLWAAMLLLVDWSMLVHRNPFGLTPWSLDSELFLYLSALMGFVLLLPLWLSWLEGSPPLPKWKEMFDYYSRVFFVACISALSVFLLLFFLVMCMDMLDRSGFRFPVSFMRFHADEQISWALLFAFTASWFSRQTSLVDILKRSFLPIVATLLPVVCLFSILFLASLLGNEDWMWSLAPSDSMVLALYACSGLAAIATWRDGDCVPPRFVRRPFAYVILLLLPLYAIPAVGAILGRYDWTVERVVRMAVSCFLLLWSGAWALSLAQNYKRWPERYRAINRIAFPLLGLMLILLVSPVADARRIVLCLRLDSLYHWTIRRPYDSIERFNWHYVAGELGRYGTDAMRELLAPGGKNRLAERMRSASSEDIRLVLSHADSVLAEAAEQQRLRGRTREERDADDRRVLAETLSALPVIGGELSREDFERVSELLLFSSQSSVSEFEEKDGEKSFFLLHDIDDDGVPELFLYINRVMYLAACKRLIVMQPINNEPAPEGSESLLDIVLRDGVRTMTVPWKWIGAKDRIYGIRPSDYIHLAIPES